MESDDPFDAILFPEDKFCEQGYKAGTEQGKKEGLAEGFATGWQQGCKLGEEVGFYRGFAESWLDILASGSSKLHLDDRKLKLVNVSLSQLQKMAGTFEIVGIEKDDFATELTKIRSKFKQNDQDGKYFKFCGEISAKSSTSELPSGHLPPMIVENGIHNQMDKAENVNSQANHFIKRRPSEMQNENEHSPISPTRKSLRRDSAWSSEPALTLNIPQVAISQGLPIQNQLRSQYDAFDDGVLLSKVIAGQLGHPELTVDERKIMRSKKFQLWRALCYFFAITSFHGLPHIAGSRSCIRICYWMFLICIALGLMVWAILFISIAFFEFNTYIKTELVEPGQLKFPAVTICNLNQYRKSYLERDLGYDETQIFIGALFVDALSSRRILTRDFDFSEINTTIGELAEMYTNDFGVNFDSTSHRLEDMLVSCYFNNEPCFRDNFTSGLNINGRCFTFNSNPSSVLNVTSPGALYGLELVLNVEQYEYFLPDVNSVGFKVYIHQQGDFPYLGEHKGFTISPGMHTNVVLSTEQLEYLEPPYGVCHKDLKLEYYPIYTREACLDECRTKGMVRTCGCRWFYMPGNATICNANDYAVCAAYYLQTFWEQNECDCPLPCTVPESYKYELSYSAYPGRHLPLLLYKAGVLANTPGIPESIRQLNATNNATAQNDLFDFFKDNMVKTTLYYNQLSLNKLTEVAEYGAFQFIADFGGHLGLFTGAGFLTLFEFVELCLGVFYPKTIDKDHHTM